MSIANLNPHVRSINGRTGDVVLTIDDFPGAGAVLSVNSLVGNVSLTSANIPEDTNLYYTDARVQTFGDARYVRLAAANIFSANQRLGPTGTATIGVPKNSYSLILSGASDVGLGSTNRSTIITQTLTGATPGLTFDVVDSLGSVHTFTMRADGVFSAPAGSIPSSHTHTSSQISDFNEAVDDRVSSLFVAGTGITFAYDDVANTLTINSSGGSGAVTSVNSQTGIVVLTTTDIAEGSNLYFTNERVDDRVATLIQAANGLTWFYNDVLGTLTPTINLGSFSTTNLPEGSNLYYTNARVLAIAAPISHTHTLSQITDAGSAASKTAGNAVGNVPLVEAGGKLNASILPAIAITDTFVVASQAAMLALSVETGDIAVRSDTNQSYILKGSDPTILANWELLRTPTDLVTSVNGQQGVVSLTTSNITEGSNLYYTDERVDDRVAALLQAGGGITWTYDDTANTLTPAVTIIASQVSNFSEAVDDRVAALLVAGSNVTLTYDDAANTYTIAASGGGSGTPGGSTTQVQFNNAGSFAGTPTLTVASNKLTITSQAAADIPLTVKAAASQSSRLLDFQNDAGTSLARIDADGTIVTAQGFIADSGQLTALHSKLADTGLDIQVRDFTSGGKNAVRMAYGTATNSSGVHTAVAIMPTYNQTSTAGASDLVINRTETAIGSGTQRLIDAQVGGVSKFNVDRTGKATVTGLVLGTASIPVPVAGDDGKLLKYDNASGNYQLVSGAGNGLIRAPQILTSGTSYITPVGCSRIIVEMIGGGGAGGSTAGAASNAAFAGGGGAGAYCEKYFTVTGNTAYTYAIGAAGTPGAIGNNPGGNGGSTTFTVGATVITAPGGTGGPAPGAAGTTSLGVLGGAGAATATNGDLNIGGEPGAPGFRASATIGMSGNGGSSWLGGGGLGRVTSGNGAAGVGYGAGGSGAVSIGNSNQQGGAGTQGVIRVWEYA